MNEKIECSECKYFNADIDFCVHDEATVRPGYGCYEGENRILTNGDKIRQMSDEELATLLTEYRNDYYLETLDWLKQEASDDEC